MNKLSLPEPDQAAREHSERLCSVIIDEIDTHHDGIGFDRFMQMALYEPGLGYYSAGANKIGATGDFVTAPVISSLFSDCVATQCKQVMDTMADACILELGAGTGVMTRDILLALEQQRQLPAQYFILEVSADLKQRQQELLQESLPHLMQRITWLDELPDSGFKGVILANEVLDAIPVKRIQIRGVSINELNVVYADGQFVWNPVVAEASLQHRVSTTIESFADELPEDYLTEINTNQNAWINSLAECLQQGVIFLIDYGYVRKEYYHPQRVNGSLLCHYQHRAHDDPFYYPGLQDITASVDFTAVAEYAETAGLTVSGFTSQANFLVGCGIDEIIANRAGDSESDMISLSAQAKQLMLPAEMGEKFKVIALSKLFDTALIGFSFNNQLQRL